MTSALDAYAVAHGLPVDVLLKAGWREELSTKGLPALRFDTASGPRWRHINGDPKYDQAHGYQSCWYGLKRAIAKDAGFIIDCNGAASTIAADYYGLPAYSLQAGETTSPSSELLSELSGYHGKIIVVFDNDEPTKYAPEGIGHRAAVKRVQVYRQAGHDAIALDLALPATGSDLADFCALHKANSLAELRKCRQLDIPADQGATKREARSHTSRDDLPALVELALAALYPSRADDHEMWVQVGMAVQAGIGETGFSMWDAWASQSPKHKERDAKIWYSFKKEGITLGTLFHYANEDNPGWRPKRETPKVFTEKVLQHTQDLTDSQERVILTYFKRSGPAVCKLIKAMLQTYAPGDPFTLKDLALRSDIPYRALCKAITQYNGSALVHHKARLDNTTETSDLTSLILEKNKTAQSGILVSPCENVWLCPTSAELSQRLADLIVAPAEYKKVGYIDPTPAIPNVTPALVEFAETAFVFGLTKEQLAAREAAKATADQAINYWRRQLARPDVTPQVVGVDWSWKTAYRDSVAAKNAQAYMGQQQSWREAFKATGLRRGALSRAEGRLGIIRRETFNDRTQPVRTIQQLPATGEYNKDYAGVATRARTEAGEILDLTKRKHYPLIKAELLAHRPVAILYQQSSTIDFMDDDEKAEYDLAALRAAEKRAASELKRQAMNVGKKKKRTVHEDHVGYDTSDTLRLLNAVELALALPTLPGASIQERIWRLTGDPLVDHLVNERGGVVVSEVYA